MKKSSSTNALLQKVSSQLRGERVKKEETEDDELNAYLKSLTQKSSQQKKSVNFEDVGDISISSELDSSSHKGANAIASSRFMKKKSPSGDMPQAQNQSRFVKKPQPSTASPVLTGTNQQRPSTSRGPAKRQAPSQNAPAGSQRSSSLDRAAALSSKITERSNLAKKAMALESDSDETFTTPRTPTPRKGDKSLSVSSDSVKIGRDRGKFMKKKAIETTDENRNLSKEKTSPVIQKKQKEDKQKPAVSKSSPFLKSSLKHSTDLVLSSEEESLAEFITGLDADSSEDGKVQEYMQKIREAREKKKRTMKAPSPPPGKRSPSPGPDAKPPTARRSPSPLSTPRRAASPKFGRRSPSPHLRRSLSRSSDDSVLSESMKSEVAPGKDEDTDSEAGFKINLMDVDSLEPVIIDASPSKASDRSKFRSKEKKQKSSPKKGKSEKSPKRVKKEPRRRKSDDVEDNVFNSFGLHTVDELLGGVKSPDAVSEASEIRTASESSEIHTEKEPPVVFNARPKTKFNDSVTEIASEIRTDKKSSYTDDFESSISEKIGYSSVGPSKPSVRFKESEGTGDEYTEEFPSETESIATWTNEGEVSRSESYVSTDGSSYTTLTRSSYAPRRKRPLEDLKDVECQTSEPGLHYAWDSRYSGLAMPVGSYGLGFVDPAPIASHFVSPDALEAMTSYSPSMIALHDMLKQQLTLTRSFLESQRYLYNSFVSGIDPTHHYTTLEETKQFIKKNRKKPLKLKEALQLVDLEMNGA